MSFYNKKSLWTKFLIIKEVKHFHFWLRYQPKIVRYLILTTEAKYERGISGKGKARVDTQARRNLTSARKREGTVVQ